MNVQSALLWGFVATVVMTALSSACQVLGLSRMSIPFLVGSMFTPHRDRAMLVGAGVHFLNGWLFAIVYALVFESLQAASWWLGGLFGLIHGMSVLLVLMPLLPAVHPRMASETQGPQPTRGLEPPGPLATNYGRLTALIALAAHGAYGVILGAFYQVG